MNFQLYFQAYKNYFFQWEEDSKVLAIPNGNTIAYRDYVVELLEYLAPNGLPKFASVLLAILATNADGKNNILNIQKILETLSFTDEIKLDAIQFLTNLSQLPPQFITGKNRLILFQKIFANAHNNISYNEKLDFIEKMKKWLI